MGKYLQLPYHWPTFLILAIAGGIGIASLVGVGPRTPNVHMSVFAYRDVNRNGIYDVEDRPYAGLNVTMDRPVGGPVQRASNISGFANFDMARSRRKGDIHSPGEYTVQVEPPEGWQVTSHSGPQSIHVTERAASSTGLVANKTFDPVGIAPILQISGVVEMNDEAAATGLEARSPNGERTTVAIANDGRFSFPAVAGEWRLELPASGAGLITRNVTVREYPVVVSKLAAMPATRPRSNASVIGFDDLTPSDTLYEIPNGYAGLNWRNWVATHQKLYGGDGYVNAAVSSEYVAYTSSGHPATLSSATTFDFVGAYIGAAWPEAEDYNVVVRAWRLGELVHEDRFRASVAGPVYFDADYRNISKLEFASDGYWQIAVDDLAVRTDQPGVSLRQR